MYVDKTLQQMLLLVFSDEEGVTEHINTVLFFLFYNKSPRGGGYLVYLSYGDVPFFRVSFSPIFSGTGYQKKANFLEQVVKTCQKRKFCHNATG